MKIAKHRGMKKAIVAPEHQLAVVMHRCGLTAPSSGGAGKSQRFENLCRFKCNRRKSSSTQRWNEVPRGTMNEVSSFLRSEPAMTLTASSPARVAGLIRPCLPSPACKACTMSLRILSAGFRPRWRSSILCGLLLAGAPRLKAATLWSIYWTSAWMPCGDGVMLLSSPPHTVTNGTPVSIAQRLSNDDSPWGWKLPITIIGYSIIHEVRGGEFD